MSITLNPPKYLCDRIRVVRSEFSEMPGLRLSRRQAERLWNLDPSSADVIFGALEQANFLRRTPNDLYVRADVGSR
ncbi:MAG: hypothetical protein EHM55_21030 [Acidobacteria bacterium]|nr:MAG: hypothetical protein EHM55_21030 [Acidobacteriota bacterium]